MADAIPGRQYRELVRRFRLPDRTPANAFALAILFGESVVFDISIPETTFLTCEEVFLAAIEARRQALELRSRLDDFARRAVEVDPLGAVRILRDLHELWCATVAIRRADPNQERRYDHAIRELGARAKRPDLLPKMAAASTTPVLDVWRESCDPRVVAEWRPWWLSGILERSWVDLRERSWREYDRIHAN